MQHSLLWCSSWASVRAHTASRANNVYAQTLGSMWQRRCAPDARRGGTTVATTPRIVPLLPLHGSVQRARPLGPCAIRLRSRYTPRRAGQGWTNSNERRVTRTKYQPSWRSTLMATCFNGRVTMSTRTRIECGQSIAPRIALQRNDVSNATQRATVRRINGARTRRRGEETARQAADWRSVDRRSVCAAT